MMKFKLSADNLHRNGVFTIFKWLKSLFKVALENGMQKQFQK